MPKAATSKGNTNSAAFAARVQKYFSTAPLAVANLLGALIRSTLKERNAPAASAAPVKQRKKRGPNRPKAATMPLVDAISDTKAMAAGAAIPGTIY